MTEQKKSKRGGKRPGAGRPKKVRSAAPTTAGQDLSAEDYLRAVVAGELPPDPDRIRAATCLIRYESTKKRTVKPAPSPKNLAETEQRIEESAIVEDFEVKAREIRARHAARKAEK